MIIEKWCNQYFLINNVKDICLYKKKPVANGDVIKTTIKQLPSPSQVSHLPNKVKLSRVQILAKKATK